MPYRGFYSEARYGSGQEARIGGAGQLSRLGWAISSFRGVRGRIGWVFRLSGSRRIRRRVCRVSTAPPPTGISASEYHPTATLKSWLPGRHCCRGPLIGAIRRSADEAEDGDQACADDGNDHRVLDERLPSLVAAGERACLNHVMTPVRALRLFAAIRKRGCQDLRPLSSYRAPP